MELNALWGAAKAISFFGGKPGGNISCIDYILQTRVLTSIACCPNSVRRRSFPGLYHTPSDIFFFLLNLLIWSAHLICSSDLLIWSAHLIWTICSIWLLLVFLYLTLWRRLLLPLCASAALFLALSALAETALSLSAASAAALSASCLSISAASSSSFLYWAHSTVLFFAPPGSRGYTIYITN